MTSTHHIHKHGKIDEPKSLAARQADVARERELHNIARERELDLEIFQSGQTRHH